MSPDEQMEKWVAGESIHNHERDECCPDFSCCNPANLAPVDERKLFRDRPDLRDNLLMGFLGRALAGYGERVHIVGMGENNA